MKRLLQILVLSFIIAANLYSEGLSLKLGMLNWQKYGINDVDLDNGLNLEMVYDFKIIKKLDIGLGMELISSELSIDGKKQGINMHPIYGELKRNFGRDKRVNRYFLYKIGINYLDAEDDNLEGRGYFALGIGAEIGHIIGQIAYDVSSIEDLDSKYSVRRFNLSIGYNFGRKYKKDKPKQKPLAEMKNDEIEILKSQDTDLETKLIELNKLRDEGLITDLEYYQKKRELLEKY